MLKFIQKILFLGAMMATMLGLMGPAMAQNTAREQLFTVSGIEVDERAATAREARTIAIAKAEAAAFQQLIVRLISEFDQSRFFLPEGARASDYVLGLEVEEERNSRVRYIATLNITFDEAKVSQLLGSQSIAFVGIAPSKTLVFPLLWQDGAWLLWQDENSFRGVWTDEVLENRIMAYALTEGDLQERTGITPDILMSGRQQERLEALLETYGAEDILVVAAKIERETFGETSHLVLDLLYPLGTRPEEQLTVRWRFPETDEELMTRALSNMIAEQDSAWKSTALTQFGSETELALIVPAQDPGEWAEALARLKATPVVQSVEIRRMAMPASTVVINYIGSQEQLALALAQKGLILLESEEGWVVLHEENKGLVANGG